MMRAYTLALVAVLAGTSCSDEVTEPRPAGEGEGEGEGPAEGEGEAEGPAEGEGEGAAEGEGGTEGEGEGGTEGEGEGEGGTEGEGEGAARGVCFGECRQDADCGDGARCVVWQVGPGLAEEHWPVFQHTTFFCGVRVTDDTSCGGAGLVCDGAGRTCPESHASCGHGLPHGSCVYPCDADQACAARLGGALPYCAEGYCNSCRPVDDAGCRDGQTCTNTYFELLKRGSECSPCRVPDCDTDQDCGGMPCVGAR